MSDNQPADDSKIELNKAEEPVFEEATPKKKKLTKAMSAEYKRRASLRRKGSNSASQTLKEFFKSNKKEQDPEKRKAANKLLRVVICEQWWVMALALPLSFLGAIQEFGTSHFIGKTIQALSDNDMDEFRTQLRTWVAIIVIGSLFAGLRDYIYGVSSEKIGMSVREKFY